MKNLFKTALCLLIATISFTARGQYAPPTSIYNPPTTHPAWTTGASFNNSSDYARGFCYGYDAASPLANGYTGPVYRFFDVPIDYYGHTYQVVLQTLAPLPDTSTWEQSANNITAYANDIVNVYYQLDYNYNADPSHPGPLPDYDEYVKQKNFWLGYAHLLSWAAQNPGVLLLQPGDGM